ncbi:Uncharacterised protein [Mycobacteroides abscessus subsp. abscessus]|uniref:hypothetical protein n=1 Tax=Mycobacteroides abscessus TaxID=36809 RepID=UPI00092A12B4|nr:hypothetical protein [Mycobacteroides abscessus]SHX68319.1 Uncharacterised protein [Mycobacteroides abscessus subsp. abscessus]SIC58115.1 Uncharacterised protein [Mycobacteroides abscessus subsp. abscessus]SKK19410.1 Uncharacterised protein [Mycobacteroides abscessus subsp. abscessus]SKP49048.1 Uncharacterised protein [Mycobacteroides abscessus subsp. abscessus]
MTETITAEITPLDRLLVEQYIAEDPSLKVYETGGPMLVRWPLDKRLAKDVTASAEVLDREVLFRFTHRVTSDTITVPVRFSDFEELYDTDTEAGMHAAAAELIERMDYIARYIAGSMQAGDPLRYRSRAVNAAA